MKHVRIEGDAEFATTIAKLAEHCAGNPKKTWRAYWATGLLTGSARLCAVGEQARRAGRNVLDSLTEYLLDEQPQLVRRSALDTFNDELSKARDALARVEKRIERLEQQAEARGATASGAAVPPRGTRK